MLWVLILDALDLVIRHARVATAADTFDSDIGIKDGVIVMLGKNLPKATKEIDAAGRVVTPGGIDGHCHLDQPMPPPAKPPLEPAAAGGGHAAHCHRLLCRRNR